VLTTAAAVRGAPLNVAQVAAIPVFILAVAATWVVARASRRHGPALARLLLAVQFGVLAAVLAVCVLAKPSADPHGLAAGIAAMLAVAAIACQFTLLRLALPKLVSTAVMTGNLTNAVLALMDIFSKGRPHWRTEVPRMMASLRLLAGFLLGCLVAAAALGFMAEWAWSLPVALAGVAIALGK